MMMMATTAPRKTNWFAIWTTVAVVVVVVVIGFIVWWGNDTETEPPPEIPTSQGIDTETGAIAVGAGANQVDLYFDFYCPHCQDFEDVYGSTIDDLLSGGEITLNLHPVALTSLNTASGTDFSKRSAGALYCVAAADPEAAYPFMRSVFAQHPTGAGLTDDELLSFAADAGASGIDQCVTGREYVDFVEAQTGAIPPNPQSGSSGTPTLVVNGEWVQVTGDPQADIVDRLG